MIKIFKRFLQIPFHLFELLESRNAFKGFLLCVVSLLSALGYSDTYTLSLSNPSYTGHSVRGGSGSTKSCSYVVNVPEGMIADVRVDKTGQSGANWATSQILAYINGTKVIGGFFDKTHRFTSSGSISISATATADISWREPIYYTHPTLGPIISYWVDHYYTTYYYQVNYNISVIYSKAYPDLSATASVSPSPYAAIEEPVKLKFTVRNSGYNASGASVAKIYDEGDNLKGTAQIGALSVGRTESHEVTLSGLTVGSNQTFRVVADANNDVEESNESNNQTTISLNIYQKVPRVVRFHSNGGIGTMQNQTVVCGTATALSLNKFTRKDCVFSGWATTPNGDVVYKDEANVLTYYDEINLFAVWTPRISVCFHSNGGKGTMTNQYVVCGISTALLENRFVREDYVFSGWSTTPNGGVTYKDGEDFLTYSNEAINLYAVWTARTCHVSFKIGDDEYGKKSYSVISSCGADLPIAQKTNYDFIGWFTEKNGGVQITSNTVFKADSTVYARFEKSRISLKLHSGTGEIEEYILYAGENIIPLNPFSREGYKFVGWAKNKNEANLNSCRITPMGFLAYDSEADYENEELCSFFEDIELYAVWSKIITCRFFANGGVGDMPDIVMSMSDYMTPECKFTKEGESFASWSVEQEDNGVVYHTAQWGIELSVSDFTGGMKFVTEKKIPWRSGTFRSGDIFRYLMSYSGMHQSDYSRIWLQFPRVDGMHYFRLRERGAYTNNDPSYGTNPWYSRDYKPYWDTMNHHHDRVTEIDVWYDQGGNERHSFYLYSGASSVEKWQNNSIRYGYYVPVTLHQNKTTSEMQAGSTKDNETGEPGTFIVHYPSVFIPSGYDLSASRTVTNVVVSAEKEWELERASDWISIEKDPSNPYKGIVTIEPNNSIEPRIGEFYASGGFPITINQASLVPSINMFFDANGGTVVTNRKWYAAGVKLGSLPTPSRDCYSFDGWYTQREGGVLIDASSVLNENTALYARWKKSIYTVQFDGNGGNVNAALRQIEFGSAIGTLPIAQKSGYDFIGWSTKQNGTEIISAESLVSSDVKLYAIFREKPTVTYIVTFDANGGSVFPESLSVSNGSAIGTLPTPTHSGYTFDGWYTAANGGTMVSALTVVTSNVTYYAHWKQNAPNPAPSPVPTPNPNPEPTPEPKPVKPELGVGDYSVVGEELVGMVPENVASVYDGYIYLNNVVMGSIQAKVAKPKKGVGKLTVAIQITGEKKLTLKGGLDIAIGEFTATDKKSGRVLILKFGSKGISGSFGKYDIDGARNFFDSKDKTEKVKAEEILKPYLGAYSMICDGGILSVTIAKKGKVTIKGAIDGNKVSAKAQALIGEDMICIPVVYSKKSVNLAFTIWLPINGGDVEIIGLDDAIIGKAGTLKNGAKFVIDGDIGDFIETEDPRTLELLPENEIITVSKSKWLVADGIKPAKVAYKKGEFTITEGKKGAGIVNPSGLKLSYKSKDGSFTGSFTAYAIVNGKLKKHKATVEGVLIGNVGYGTITIKKIGTWGVKIE